MFEVLFLLSSNFCGRKLCMKYICKLLLFCESLLEAIVGNGAWNVFGPCEIGDFVKKWDVAN